MTRLAFKWFYGVWNHTVPLTMKILAKKNMAKSLYEDISKMVAKEFLVFNSPQKYQFAQLSMYENTFRRAKDFR